MDLNKTMEWVDVRAPREEVFALITNLERRMQLSPLWGHAKIGTLPENYPQVGSTYTVTYKPPADDDGATSRAEMPGHQTVITDYDPPRKFAYCLDVDQQTSVTWNLSETATGTRLTYTEEYLVDPQAADEFNGQVRKIVKSWLTNLKNYAELRDARWRLWLRWLLDRYFLKMGPDQRKVVAIILFMHITGFIAFAMAAVGMGIAGLFL